MDISLTPTPLLQRELIKPTGVFPSYLVMAELQKRVTMKQQGDASKAQGPTVAQQLSQQPTAYAGGGPVRSYENGLLNPDGTPAVQSSMSPGGYWQGIIPWLLGTSEKKVREAGNFKPENDTPVGWQWLRGLAGSGAASAAEAGAEPPVSATYRDEGRNYPTPFVTPKNEPPKTADDEFPTYAGKGSTNVRAGIGAYAPGAAPDLSKFTKPEMGTFTPAARPDFEKIRSGISLPDRSEGLSRGIAAMEGRVNDAEKNNFRRSLMEFGLGALSSKSPWVSVGVGEAGLGALKGMRAAEAEQDKQRMDLLRAQGDVARLQGEGDRAALQAAGQQYNTQMQAATAADSNAVQMLTHKYGTEALMRSSDLQAAASIYNTQEQAKARMQAAAMTAQARQDKAQADEWNKALSHVARAEQQAHAGLNSDQKYLMMLDSNPLRAELMRAERIEAARQEVIARLPVRLQREIQANYNFASGGAGAGANTGIVQQLPQGAKVAPR